MIPALSVRSRPHLWSARLGSPALGHEGSKLWLTVPAASRAPGSRPSADTQPVSRPAGKGLVRAGHVYDV
ncbi:hypothetical protein GCM10010417_32860 [Streptomyces carpaticus]